MRALTICQPFAELIVADANTLPTGQSPKRVENRNWPTEIRGDFLIHAGKNLKWFGRQNWSRLEHPVPMGAIVGIATLAHCVGIDTIRLCHPDIVSRWPWLTTHKHAEGRFCWVLENVRRFVTPIPYAGLLGFWDVPDEVINGKPLELTR
ncbi:MAG: hypothetical protein ACKV2Q_18025 [Planctomycetaceae bacterium]